MNTDLLVAKPGSKNAEDGIVFINGELRGMWSGKTLDEMNREQIDAGRKPLELWNCVAFIKKVEDQCITDPVAITKEEFNDALEALPPVKWVANESVSTFQFSEHHWHTITRHYVRIGLKYYSFLDRSCLTHAQRIEKVLKHTMEKACA